MITPVDYDHLEMLGPELAKIAWEKAGIIKPGRPAVVARQLDEALAVIEAEADALGAPLILMGRDFDAWEERGRLLVQTARPPARPAAAQPVRRAPVRQRRPGGRRRAVLGDPRIDEAAIGRGRRRAPSGRRASSA